MAPQLRSGSYDLLAGVVRSAFDGRRQLVEASRLEGGSKKGVYRLGLDDGSTAIFYSWADSENFWQSTGVASSTDEPANPFSDATGLGLFTAASQQLAAIGVRAPRVLLADDSRTLFPADIAVVEDVRGETLEALWQRDPAAAGPVLDRLAGSLRSMREHRSERFGKVLVVRDGGPSAEPSCAAVVLARALRHLDEVIPRDGRIAAASDRLRAALGELAAVIAPRAEHGLIHGELGPDHVLVDEVGQPVLIDIEGLMHFDVEWEHVFLRLRFGDHYDRLRVEGLDPQRMRLYQLALHLSLVAAPLRLLDGDYPHRELMAGIAEHNLARALEFVSAG